MTITVPSYAAGTARSQKPMGKWVKTKTNAKCGSTRRWASIGQCEKAGSIWSPHRHHSKANEQSKLPAVQAYYSNKQIEPAHNIEIAKL